MAKGRTRYERRRSRLRFEELAAWIVVPVVFVLCWSLYANVFAGSGAEAAAVALLGK